MTEPEDTEARAFDTAPTQHEEPTTEQAQIVQIVRSVGEMANAVIPLLTALPDTWYDWPCDNQSYPQTCNTVATTEFCDWCRNQAMRPYAAGLADGLAAQEQAAQVPAMEQAVPAQTKAKGTSGNPAKRAAAKKAPAKKAASKPAASKTTMKRTAVGTKTLPGKR